QKELDVKSNEEKTNKISVQINLAKTNKEYAIFQKELNNLKSDNSVLEDETLNLLAQAEEVQQKVQTLDKDIDKIQKYIKELTQEVETSIKRLDEELEKLRAKRSELAPHISPEIITCYEKILENKTNRIALAQVIDGACQGCHMDLAPQDINNLMKLKEVVVCRNCSRMLYL
ncbi:zinc ribbon domain-containing protein, partial [Planctomycetota bacterium]